MGICAQEKRPRANLRRKPQRKGEQKNSEGGRKRERESCNTVKLLDPAKPEAGRYLHEPIYSVLCLTIRVY